jgi:hypothetical protein
VCVGQWFSNFWCWRHTKNRELKLIIRVHLFLEILPGLVPLVLGFWLILFSHFSLSRFLVTNLSNFRGTTCNNSFFNVIYFQQSSLHSTELVYGFSDTEPCAHKRRYLLFVADSVNKRSPY